MRWDRLKAYCTALLCVFVATPVALADFTPINPPHPGEDSHEQILSNIYGGTFVPDGSVDFSNGILLAKRVDDFFPARGEGGYLEMGGPTGGDDDTDQTWRAQFTNAIAEAKFAAFDQNFGYFLGPEGGTYQQLFNVTGDGYAVTGEAVIPLLSNQLLRWGRGGEGRILSSRIADNDDNQDHMVTYQILVQNDALGSGEPRFRWLIFWEDIRAGEPFEDWDFQDLVVEITAIPEPAMLSALGLIPLLGLRRRRR